MKKIISLLATVAMVSTLFVSVVKADVAPTVTSVVGEKVTNEEFYDYMVENIPEGYDVYPVTVSFSNLGELKCTVKAGKHSGRKLQGFTYTLDFDDLSKVDQDYTILYSNVFDDNMPGGFELGTSKFNAVFNSGGATGSYPKSTGTVSGSISDCLVIWVVVKSGETVNATLSCNTNFVEYTSNTPGDDESYNTSTMTPASLVFGSSAPVEPTPVYTDSSIDVKKPVSGTTGLTDLQGREVTLTKNYGIAKFSKEIDTNANNYFLAVEAENGDKDDLAIDFDLKGVEIRGASTTFFAIVKSADHIIKNIRLKEIAK